MHNIYRLSAKLFRSYTFLPTNLELDDVNVCVVELFLAETVRRKINLITIILCCCHKNVIYCFPRSSSHREQRYNFKLL